MSGLSRGAAFCYPRYNARMTRWQKILQWWNRYERHLNVAAAAIGFTFDLWIAKRPDSVPDNVLLLTYLLISGSIIVLLNMREVRPRKPEAEPLLLLLILQFCFGGLANNLLVLYGKSGTFAGDFIFLAILVGMVVGNELLKSRYDQLRFNIAVYYFLLLTYCIIAVPTFILHEVGTAAFLLSGTISLAVAAVFLFALYATARLFEGKQGRGRLLQASGIVVAIFALYNALYFSNFIPPVPLSLKSIGIYHALYHVGDTYSGAFEPAGRFVFWRDTAATFHATVGEHAYCFSSVFAPAGLDTPIHHEWQYYGAKGWETEADVPFQISGGRAAGYRGFSEKVLLQPGDWRCNVETARGELVGRITFTVVPVATSSPLVDATL